jgi:hypothetical protein
MPLLLTLRPLAGPPVAFAVGDPVDTDTVDGVTVYASGATVGDLSAVLSWSPDLSARSVEVQLIADGLGPLLADGAEGELAEWDPGAAWVDRHVLLIGRVTAATFTPLQASLTLAEDPALDLGDLLDPGAAVRAATWPRTDAQRTGQGWPASTSSSSASPAAEGLAYPVILGCPSSQIPLRVLGGAYSVGLAGSPLLYVERSASTTAIDDHVFVLAGHPVAASHVRWGDPTARPLTLYREPVLTAEDAQGRRVAVLTPGGSGSIPADDSPETWAFWDPADGGGMLDPYGPGALRRADHVVRWALDRSTARVDRPSLSRLAPLAGILIDCAIWEPVRPLDWLQSQILPLLPVGACAGPDGLAFYMVDPDAPALLTLTVGLDCAWDGAEEIDATTMLSRVVVRYALAGQSGRTVRRVTLCGKRRPEEASDPDVLLDPWAALAHPLAPRAEAEIVAEAICDAASAIQIARHRLRLDALPRRSLRVAVTREVGAALRPGDRVDIDLGVPGPDGIARCMIEAVDAGPLLTLSLRRFHPAPFEVT